MTEISIPEAIQFADEHLRNGQYERCEELLSLVLNAQPNNVRASAVRWRMRLKTKPYKFSNDWFQQAAWYWSDLFSDLGWDRLQPKVIVEIGCFEGQSTSWVLENLLDHAESKLYCIDTFLGSIEHADEQRVAIEERFFHNVSLTEHKATVEVRKGFSHDRLPELIVAGVKADFIYIDGSHKSKDVLMDAVLGWLLLRPGGLVVFDDYLWPLYRENPALSPKLAIDSFINCMGDDIEFVGTPQNVQFAVRKGR